MTFDTGINTRIGAYNLGAVTFVSLGTVGGLTIYAKRGKVRAVMKKGIILLLCLSVMVLTGSVDGAMSYLDNGTVKIGIDTLRGATITYMSASGSSRNVINYADLGREVQQS